MNAASKWVGRVLCTALILVGLGRVAVQAEEANLPELMQALGFEPSDAPKLLAGEVLSGEISEGGGKELAITLALFVKAPATAVAKAVKDGKTLEASSDIHQRATLGNPTKGEAELAKINLPAAELAALAKVKAGSDFNLSQAEISAIQQAAQGKSDTAAQAAVATAFKKALVERVRTYQSKGVAGIAPYDRGGSSATPAQELRGAIERDTVLRQRQPEIYAAFHEFPKQPLAGAEHQFLALLQDANGRPALVLSHRMFASLKHGTLLAERQFYVGHSYNSLQVLVGAIPAEGGTVLFYRNRTFTDQVAGFGGAAKRGIGKGMMRDQISKKLESIRSQVFE